MEEKTNPNISYNEQTKKKKGFRRYLITVSLLLILTIGSVLFSLYQAGGGDIVEGGLQIVNAIGGSDYRWLLVLAALLIVSYLLDGLVIFVFARLYTRRYHYYQGLANTCVGAFYNNVTPGASGGQVMQVYTLKTQGIAVSNAASIMVMWFILYQASLIVMGVISIAVMWNRIADISVNIGISIGGWDGTLTIIPLIIIGFGLNLSVIAVLILMSYSHRFHNFIMHYVVGFLGKIRLVKNPDRTRENLRIQVENFKIELKRLQANIPVTILIFVLFFVILTIRFSMPYFAGMALNALPSQTFDISLMFDACFRNSFHQMVTGLIPIPGSAGISEVFFNIVFGNFFGPTIVDGTIIRSAEVNLNTAQIIWRTATFHLVFIICGLVTSLYRSRPKDNFHYANRQTFVDLQLATYEERKHAVDTLYETRQLSRKEIQKRLLPFGQETGDATIEEPLKRAKSPEDSVENNEKEKKKVKSANVVRKRSIKKNVNKKKKDDKK